MISDIEQQIKDLYEKEYPPAAANPCKECPWVRTSSPGYLGPHTAEEWVEIAHSDAPIACHMTIRNVDEGGNGSWDDPMIRQCKGSAIFRANICKGPRNPSVAVAEANRDLVFGWDDEFINHHEGE